MWVRLSACWRASGRAGAADAPDRARCSRSSLWPADDDDGSATDGPKARRRRRRLPGRNHRVERGQRIPPVSLVQPLPVALALELAHDSREEHTRTRRGLVGCSHGPWGTRSGRQSRVREAEPASGRLGRRSAPRPRLVSSADPHGLAASLPTEPDGLRTRKAAISRALRHVTREGGGATKSSKTRSCRPAALSLALDRLPASLRRKLLGVQPPYTP